jgi:thymidylate kinase
MKLTSNVECRDATPPTAGAIFAPASLSDGESTTPSPLDLDTSIQFAQQVLLTQLQLRGLRHCVTHTKQQETTESYIGIHPDDIGGLRNICRGLSQVKLLRFVGLSGEYQIIFESPEMGRRKYIAVRVVPLECQKTTARDNSHSVIERLVDSKSIGSTTTGTGHRGLHSATASPRSAFKVARRDTRAWLRPSGVFCVVMGPDGVGKSTIIQRLRLELEALSIPCTAGRWRPGVIRRVTPDSSNRMPHAKSLRGSFTSSLCLLGLALDFAIGYAISTYPAMARTEIVIFDRYFHDLLIDPKRYRYAGPMWLPRLISRMIPPRKALFVILDADEDVILSRKQELPPDELRRQRIAYRTFASHALNSIIISAHKPVDEMVRELVDKIIDILASRNASPPTAHERVGLESASQSTAPSSSNS